MQKILLVDNGSRRADSVLKLRRLAAALGKRIGHPVDAVSLQHADKIPADELEGRPAEVLPRYLENALHNGVRDFLLLPLFFGRSKAITAFVPDTVAALQADHGDFQLRIADVLCPLPQGEPLLAKILADNVSAALPDAAAPQPVDVILVDHGSPSRQVTAVRETLATQLQGLLPPAATLHQAVMERRPGKEYDFNGPLLETRLEQLARENPTAQMVIAMLFLSPGRHAGAGGDMEEICNRARRDHPGISVHISPLVGDHPALIDLLAQRYSQASPAR